MEPSNVVNRFLPGGPEKAGSNKMFLIVIKGINTGSIFPLNKVGPIVIGRGKECNILILDLMISRRHCRIERRGANFYIKDLNSTNKTIVKGRIIDKEEKLKADDIIQIGKTVLLFTNQIEVPVKSVADYNEIRKSQTRSMDSSSAAP